MKLPPPVVKNLPHDTESLYELVTDQAVKIDEQKSQLTTQERLIKKYQRELALLQSKLEKQIRHRFGRRTENKNQLELFKEETAERFDNKDALEANDDKADLEEATSVKKRPKREPIIADNFEVEEAVIKLPTADCVCENCNAELTHFGEEETLQYDYVPSSIKVRKTTRHKYGCQKCDNGTVKIGALPPQPIPKSNAGPGILAETLVSKYEDHLPLYRIQRIFKRHGVDFSRSSLSDWVMKCGILLAPIVDAMKGMILDSHHIFTDDTTVPVQNGRGKTKTGRLWVYIGDEDNPYYIFEYSPSRAARFPIEVLCDYDGYIHADAYPGYDSLFKPKIDGSPHAIEVSCWAHTRRYFFNAAGSKPPLKEAVYAIDEIAKLYKIESEAKELSDEQRKAYRLTHAKPILDAFKNWLDSQSQTVGHHDFKKAVTYTLNQWESLNTYLEDGRLSIDNNISERAIRPIAVGRKNWMFAGSDGAAKNAAVIQSLISTSRAHGIDPFLYLHDALIVMAKARDEGNTEEMATFTPLEWKNVREHTENAGF